MEIWEKEEKIRRTCMLMISHACNLNCSYCYEKFKSAKKMSFSIAKEAIQKEISFVKRSKKLHELEIDLMGGEPMTNFQLVVELVEWAENGGIDIPYIFHMTTNGTLFFDEEKKWFKKHKKSICCGISYDGNIEVQEENRGKKSTEIDIDFFVKTWPFQGVHMTISPESLHSLAKNVLDLQSKGIRVEMALAEGIDWSLKDAEVYREQLNYLSEYYCNHSDLKPVYTLTRSVIAVDPKKDKRKISTYCGSGTYMITYDPDGRAYGCHMFSPIVLGKDAVPIKKESLCKKIGQDPVCLNCILKHYCPTCAGFNYRYRGDVAIRDKRRCLMFYYEALTAAEFQIKILSQKENLTKTDKEHANEALKSYELLKQVRLKNFSCFCGER